MPSPVAQVNALRAARFHLNAQVSAGVDTRHATLDEARDALRSVEDALSRVEAVAREHDDAAYLFHCRRRKKSAPRGVQTLPVLATYEVSTTTTSKEDDMARKSKAVQLEETIAELAKYEKRAGSTKWALSGAGAKKNPPSAEKKAHLTAKLEAEQAKIAELRAKRDELRG